MNATEELPTTPGEHPHGHRPNRLYQTAAWVAIVAGIVFIVGAVFFTGFALGRHGGYGGWWGHHGRIDRMSPPMMDRDEGPGGMMGPGMMGPGMMGPGMMGPGMMGPGMQTSAPAPPPPRS